MLYHFDATHRWFPGGSLGVDIFFVLSGFLITSLLLEERSRHGANSLLGFYRRRARRLLPALVLFLAIFAVITIVSAQPGAERLPGTIGMTLLYVFNWLDDFGGSGVPGAGHLWSLSVEEQFYLLWPLVLIIALRSRAVALIWFSLAAFAISASLPAWSGREYGDLYTGTDFRAQQLMAGAILAQLRFAGVITPAFVNRVPFRAAHVLAVLFFTAFILTMENRPAFLFTGMYTAAAVLGGVLVCAALYAPPRILTNGVLRYVGTRSYALYLWHHVFDFWLRDLADLPQLALSVVLSFAAAEVSWWLVEGRDSLLWKVAGALRQRFTRPDSESIAVRPAVATQR